MQTKRRTPITQDRMRLATAWIALALFASADARAVDVCGCDGMPSLGAFDTNDPNYLASIGATNNNVCGPDTITVPLPADGVLVFDSMRLRTTRNGTGCNSRVVFTSNAANTAVTLLVKGDLTIESNGQIDVGGGRGADGQDGTFGGGGGGGQGGFAGGDGAYQIVNFATEGGAGVGPGGGLGATLAERSFGGTLFSVPELRPLVGGSGGGGGHSGLASFQCSGGGGGGGGGAILIAANGTIDIQSGGVIHADGGGGGTRRDPSCSSGGSGGSGGAIRLAATTIQGAGSITANGGAEGCCSGAGSSEGARAGGPGRIRLEAITNTFSSANTSPVAVRAPAPGPLVNPITPTVRITSIDGAATPQEPVGHLGRIDMLVDAPGAIQIGLASSEVPAGTDLQLTVKPKVGGAPFSQNVTLTAGNCASGQCTTTTTVNLDPGAYIMEARATFQVP